MFGHNKSRNTAPAEVGSSFLLVCVTQQKLTPTELFKGVFVLEQAVDTFQSYLGYIGMKLTNPNSELRHGMEQEKCSQIT